MDESKKELPTNEFFVKNSFWNTFVILFAKIGGVIFSVMLARFLLPEKFGTYTLAFSIVSFSLSLITFATDQTLSRYLSDSLAKKDYNTAKSYYKFISKIKFFRSLLLIFIIAIIAYPLSYYIYDKKDLFVPLLIFSVYIITLSFQNIYETIFYVFGKVKILAKKEMILQLSKIIFCLIPFLIFYVDIPVAIFSVILSSILATFFMRSNIKKFAGFLLEKQKEDIDKPKIKKFINRTMFFSVCSTLLNFSDVIILGFFVTSAYIGYYSSAYLIIGGLVSIMSFSNISLPLFTKLDKLELKTFFERIMKYFSIISIPLIFGILVFGRYIIVLFYGYEYLNAAIPLLIFSLVIFEIPITDNLIALLLAKEKPESLAKIVFFAAILNILLSFILVPSLMKISMTYAIAGTAIAIVISRFSMLFALNNKVKKNLGISYNLKLIIKPLIASIIMVIPSLLINYFIKDMTLILGILEIILSIIIFFTILFLIKGIEKRDFFIIRDLIFSKS
jgi:O-antigen/teichoic acid export membrane protein